MLTVFSGNASADHRVPAGFPEEPRRTSAILEHLDALGRYAMRTAPEQPDRVEMAIRAVHEPRYLERFAAAVARGDGLLDGGDNPLSPGTERAARGAVAVALAATDAALDGGSPTIGIARPPGHHAERGLAMGFCYFNNVAIAAEALLARPGIARVAIYDFDVHHGNGTQHLFEERADVLYVSTHQFPYYPGTGAAEECGRGAGRGTTVNVPLPAGSDDAGYRQVHRAVVWPAIERFAPDVLLVSAGFDAWQADPLGGMRVTEAGFREWGEEIGRLAARTTSGRVASLLEGGYDLAALPHLIEAYLEGLCAGFA